MTVLKTGLLGVAASAIALSLAGVAPTPGNIAAVAIVFFFGCIFGGVLATVDQEPSS